MANEKISYEDAFGATDPSEAPLDNKPKGVSYEDAFGLPPSSPGILRKAGDLGLSVAKGVIGVPEAAVGLLDIPTGGAVGKFLENEGGTFGFRPKQAKDYLSSFQSDDLQAKQKQFQDADGVLDKAGVALSNPSLLANAVAESVPSIGAGGVAARGLLAAAPRIGAVAAGALGEGAVSAGSAASNVRQETEDGLLTAKQPGLAAATGAATALFGFAGGKIAQRLGIGDVDTMLTQGAIKTAGAPSAKSIPRQVVEGAIAEGWLEELPQSVSEQVLQNLALNKPWHEGVSDAAVMGTLAGMAMGGGAAGVSGFAQDATTQNIAAASDGLGALGPAFTTAPGAVDPNAAQAPVAQAPEAPDLSTTLGAGVPRDGVPFTRDIDTSGLAVEDRGAMERARAAMVDYEPGDATPQWETSMGATAARQGLDMPAPEFDTGTLGLERQGRALTTSERMGINPAAGALSRAAAVAVDSGATPVQFLGATGRDLQARATGPGVTNESNVIDVQGRLVEDRAISTPSRLTDQQDGMAARAQGDRLAIQPPAAPSAVPALGGPVGADAARGGTTAVPDGVADGRPGGGSAAGNGAGAAEAGAARAGGRGNSNPALSAPTNLREGLARMRARRQEAANAQTAAQSAPTSAPAVSTARPGAVEAAGLNRPKSTRKAAEFDARKAAEIEAGALGAQEAEAAGVPTQVTWLAHRKWVYSQAPRMTLREFQAALKGRHGMSGPEIEAYYKSSNGGAEVSAAKITTEGTANVPQADQAQQTATQPTQAGAAQPTQGLTDAAPPQNNGAQAAPATGTQGAAQAAQTGVAPRPKNWRTSMLGATPVAKAMGIDTKGKRLAQVVAEIDARDTQAPATPAPAPDPGPTRLGRDNTPLSEGGKPFKTRKAAGDAKKMQPMMRVVTVPGGYALAEKTPAQLAAEERAAKRLRTPRTSPAGEPVPAHAFIAASGGLHMRHRNDLGVDGNPRIGNRRLFGGLNRGLSIEQATEMLVADGYLSEGASHNDAYALIKKSLSQPQYNADGIERIAQAESDAQFEDYMAAQEEAAAEGDMDPFDMAGEFTADELDDVGYASASPALQAEVNALIAQADAMDIDTYAILEDIARTYANATKDQYNAAARDALAAAIARSNQDGGSAAAQAAPAAEPAAEQELNRPEAPANQAQVATESVAPEALELAAQTPAEAAAQQDSQEQAAKAEAAAKRAEDAAAKAEEDRKRIAQASVRAADSFELGQDPMDSLTGQGGLMFSRAPAGGQTETAAFKRWFGDSKVVDADGKPLVVYHGTDDDISVFDESKSRKGFWFSSDDSDASDYGGNTVEAYLSLKRPAYFERTSGDKGVNEAISIAKSEGYDGLIVTAPEDGDASGMYWPTNYVAFRPEQIKSATGNRGAFDPDNADIRFSRGVATEVRNLVTLHNLTDENLRYADSMGGIPVPSIGITKVESPFGGFGNITLIAPKGMIDPKAGVPVYDRDAWTARFPTMNFKKVKAKMADAFYERMKPVRELMAGDDDGFISQLWEQLRNASVQSPEKITGIFTRYEAGRVMYAKEVLGKTIKVPMRNVRPATPVGHDAQLLAYWKKHGAALILAEREMSGAEFSNTPENKAFEEEVQAAIRRYADAAGAPEMAKGFIEQMMPDGTMGAGTRDRLIRDFKTYGTKEVDRIKLGEAVNKAVKRDDPAYLRWVESLVKPLFDEPTITLRGREVAPTLDNIVDAMTVGATAGAEKSMTFSPGKVAAMLGKQFKSLDEIKAARDQVVSAKAETEGKKATDALLTEYRTHVSQFYGGKDWRGNIDTWAANDDSMEALAKAGKLPPSDASIRATLARMNFKGVDQRAVDMAREAIAALRNAATDYFEAKPQRAVTLDEFKGAVVPKGTSAETIAILEKHGIAVEVHNKTEGAREKAIQKLAKRLDRQSGDVLFTRSTDPSDPYQHKLQAIQAARKQAADVVQADNGQWLLAPKAEPYTAQEARDAQQRIDKLNRALGKYSSVAPAAVLSDAPTAAMAWGRSVARTLGYNVTFIRPNPDFHGVAVGGDAFVSASAEHPEIGLIGHEVLHSFKQSDPDTYEALAERIRPYLKNGVVDAKRKWEDARGGQNTSMAMAEEEVFADLNGAMWLDPLFWREMASNDPSLFRQVAYKFMEVATKAMKGLSRFKADALVTDVDAVRKIIAQEWATQAQEMGNPSEFSETDGPAFSRAPGDQTKTEAFKRWFAGSRVVDADGKPLLVYHGTTKDFDAFDQDSVGDNFGRDNDGFFFTGSAVEASGYADPQSELLAAGRPDARRMTPLAQANVMPVYLSIKNPLTLERYTWAIASSPEVEIDESGVSLIDFFDSGNGDVTRYAKEKGHDGVLFQRGGETLAVAFFPEQIKSATGNRGTFDPANPDIRFSRTSTATGTQSAWDAPVPTGFDDVIYKLQDKNIDLKRVVEAITKSAGQVADSVNAYLKEELFHKRAAKRVEDFSARELKPLMNQMRLMGLGMEDVEEYLHARHAKEANAVIAQRNPGEPGLQDGGSGMTNQAADNYFAKLDPAQRRKLEAVAKNVDAIIDKTRKLYVSYGLENQDVVDGWASMYQHYIPLMREDKDGGMGTGQGFSVKGKETKGRTGSTRKVVDILANIASQREKLIVRGEKNQVTQALIGLARANPNSDFWEVRSQAPTERVFDPKKGIVVDRPDPLFKSRDNVVVAKVQDSKGNVTEQMVVFNEDNPRAVRMAAAMKNLDAGNLEGLLGMSAKITRYFSAINTQYNPVFGVVNLVRDVQGAMVNLAATPLAGQQGKIARDTVSALAGIYSDIRKTRKGGQASSKWAQLWEQMQDDGGTTGYRELFTTSADRADNLKSILNPQGWMDSKWGKVFTADGKLRVPMSMAQKGASEIFGWLSDYNEAMENGVRLAAYKASLDMGMSREQAASLSKNLTVNFNRKGQVGMQAGAVYAFFNAAMQGTARIGQTLFDMDGGDISTLRLSKTGKAVVYGGVTLGVMQALALAGAGFDEEDPPEFVRERSLIIPTGGKTYVSIPMPLGLHVIPGIGRHATEFALSGFDKPAKRALSVIGMFADAFNPIGNAGLSMQTLAPTALDPLVALTENKDWTGKPIARASFNKALPGHTQWKDTATWYSKMAAEAINWVSGGNEYVAGALSPTPDQIDYLIAQVGGGVAREASKVFQAASTTVNGEELPTYKIPLLGRFAGNAASQASQGTAFYANLDRLNALETEIKGLRKDGRFGEAAQLARENPQAAMIPMANRAERDVQKLRRDKRELIATGATREEVRAKEAQITAVMARLNEAAARRKATSPE